MSSQNSADIGGGGALEIPVYKDIEDKDIDPNMTRYVFWPGFQPLPLAELRIHPKTAIPPMSVFAITNYKFIDRDQDFAKERELVRVTKKAAHNLDHLLRLYAHMGLVEIEELRGMDSPEDIKRIAKAANELLPKKSKTLQEARSLLDDGLKSDDMQAALAFAMLNAFDQLERYEVAELESRRAEMEQRKVPGGEGIPRLCKRDKEAIRFLGRSESDYVTDTRATADATAKQIQDSFKAVASVVGQQQAPDYKGMFEAMVTTLQEKGLIVPNAPAPSNDKKPQPPAK